MSKNRKVEVSVSMITYNHGKFIAEAISSVLAQKTDFYFEIIIGNDNSSDETDRIIVDFISKNSNPMCEIIYLKYDRQQGMMKNFVQAFAKARGQFIALCEGDDFWQSSDKLQKQIDALRSRPQATVCFHDVNVVGDNSEFLGVRKLPENTKPSFSSLLNGNFIYTCSVLYRNVYASQLPSWMEKVQVGDWPCHLLHAKQGEIIYLPEIMASYRVHSGGVWSLTEQSVRLTKWLSTIDILLANGFSEYAAKLNYSRKKSTFLLFIGYLKLAKFGMAFENLKMALKMKSDPAVGPFEIFKAVFKRIFGVKRHAQ